MELSKPSKPDASGPVRLRPIDEAPQGIIFAYATCEAIRNMVDRGDMVKAAHARVILDKQVAHNRSKLKLIIGGKK